MREKAFKKWSYHKSRQKTNKEGGWGFTNEINGQTFNLKKKYSKIFPEQKYFTKTFSLYIYKIKCPFFYTIPTEMILCDPSGQCGRSDVRSSTTKCMPQPLKTSIHMLNLTRPANFHPNHDLIWYKKIKDCTTNKRLDLEVSIFAHICMFTSTVRQPIFINIVNVFDLHFKGQRFKLSISES